MHDPGLPYLKPNYAVGPQASHCGHCTYEQSFNHSRNGLRIGVYSPENRVIRHARAGGKTQEPREPVNDVGVHGRVLLRAANGDVATGEGVTGLWNPVGLLRALRKGDNVAANLPIPTTVTPDISRLREGCAELRKAE